MRGGREFRMYAMTIKKKTAEEIRVVAHILLHRLETVFSTFTEATIPSSHTKSMATEAMPEDLSSQNISAVVVSESENAASQRIILATS